MLLVVLIWSVHRNILSCCAKPSECFYSRFSDFTMKQTVSGFSKWFVQGDGTLPTFAGINVLCFQNRKSCISPVVSYQLSIYCLTTQEERKEHHCNLKQYLSLLGSWILGFRCFSLIYQLSFLNHLYRFYCILRPCIVKRGSWVLYVDNINWRPAPGRI